MYVNTLLLIVLSPAIILTSMLLFLLICKVGRIVKQRKLLKQFPGYTLDNIEVATAMVSDIGITTRISDAVNGKSWLIGIKDLDIYTQSLPGIGFATLAIEDEIRNQFPNTDPYRIAIKLEPEQGLVIRTKEPEIIDRWLCVNR